MSTQIWGTTFATETMGAPHLRPPANDQWWQNVLGIPALPGVDSGFQLQVGAAYNPNLYVSNAMIPSVPGSSGPVMFQSVLAPNDPGDLFGDVRSNWFFDQDFETHGDEWIQTARIQMQDTAANLLAAMTPTGGFTFNFRQLWEVKIGPIGVPPTLRFGFGIEWRSSFGPVGSQSRMRWVAAGGTEPLGEQLFAANVVSPAVIGGAWFDMEIYARFHQTNGQFTVKINGATIFDFAGVQTLPTGLALSAAESRWKLASLYTAVDRMPMPHFQYVDSIQLAVPDVGTPVGAATSGSRKLASVVRARRVRGTSRGRPRASTANLGWQRSPAP